MSTELQPITFYGDTLFLVEHNGEPYAPMKPIADALGLSWGAQTVKLKAKFGATIAKIEMVAPDGKIRDMLSLPLRKLPVFLYSIELKKVKSEVRHKVAQYQAECDDVLWKYWFKDHASNAHKEVLPPALPEPETVTLTKDELLELQGELINLLRFKTESLGPLPKRPVTGTQLKRLPTVPITDAEIATIYDLQAKGLSIAEIGRRIGRSSSVVSYILRAKHFSGQSSGG